MKLIHLLNKKYSVAHSIACCIYPMEDVRGMDKFHLQNYVAKSGDDVPSILPIDEIDNLVHLVNIEVKDENCPHSCKNRFYHWKHEYIKEQISRDNIEKVLESDNYYHFFIKGGNSYHQFKNTFPNGVSNIVGTETYSKTDRNVLFNEDDFNKTIIQMVLFVNQKEIEK